MEYMNTGLSGSRTGNPMIISNIGEIGNESSKKLFCAGAL
jgi:hypothetical protein